MHYSTKRFGPYSCAHRQAKDTGHCRFIHGYARTFRLTFCADELDPETNFVMHFGQLDFVKAFLAEVFDHTLLINNDDPEADTFVELEKKGLCKLIRVNSVATEILAQLVFEQINSWLAQIFNGQNRTVACCRVECCEHENNSGIFEDNPRDTLDRVRLIQKKFIADAKAKAAEVAKAELENISTNSDSSTIEEIAANQFDVEPLAVTNISGKSNYDTSSEKETEISPK